MDKKVITGISAAFGASLCCITPVLAVLAGSTGMASSFSWMEPFRPYLISLTVIVLTYAWWDKLKPVKEGMDCSCEVEGEVSFWYSKKLLAIITIFATAMLSFPYWGDSLIKSDKPKLIIVDKKNIVKSTINIEGMTCSACEATVEKVGSEVVGVVSIKVSAPDKHAIVEFDKSKTDINTIMKAIETTGFRPILYDDDSGKHDESEIEVKEHKREAP